MKYIAYFSICILLLLNFSEGVISGEIIQINRNESQNVEFSSNLIVKRYDSFLFN